MSRFAWGRPVAFVEFRRQTYLLYCTSQTLCFFYKMNVIPSTSKNITTCRRLRRCSFYSEEAFFKVKVCTLFILDKVLLNA